MSAVLHFDPAPSTASISCLSLLPCSVYFIDISYAILVNIRQIQPFSQSQVRLSCLHACRIAGLQDCRIAGLQDCRIAGLQLRRAVAFIDSEMYMGESRQRLTSSSCLPFTFFPLVFTKVGHHIHIERIQTSCYDSVSQGQPTLQHNHTQIPHAVKSHDPCASTTQPRAGLIK
jgi:hypothetical protein